MVDAGAECRVRRRASAAAGKPTTSHLHHDDDDDDDDDRDDTRKQQAEGEGEGEARGMAAVASMDPPQGTGQNPSGTGPDDQPRGVGDGSGFIRASFGAVGDVATRNNDRGVRETMDGWMDGWMDPGSGLRSAKPSPQKISAPLPLLRREVFQAPTPSPPRSDML
ncbi:hypothetical protein BKA80DRAFT_98786 [Phyllosticta citrichinensis]